MKIGKRNKIAQRSNRIFSVSPLTPITIIVLTLLGHGAALLSYAAVLIVHEFAHAFTAERLGYSLRSIRVMPYGISISGDFECLRPTHEVAIALAGPAINLLMWIVLTGLWWSFPETYTATQLIAEASLFTALINLLPVYPLDGGRIFHGVLSSLMTQKSAEKTLRIVSLVIGGIVAVSCIVLIVTGANFTFATLGIFIIASLLLPGGGKGYERIYSMANSEKRLENGLKVREIMVSKNATLLSMYKMLRHDCYTRFLVTDGQMNIVMTLTETELDGLISRFNTSEKAISLAKLADK